MNSQDIQNIQESYLAVYDDETRENLEFENWVNNLLDEGYDLSDYTWDEMAEIYIGEETAPGVKTYQPRERNPLPKEKPPSGETGDGSGYGKPKDGKDPLDTNKSDYNRFTKGLAPTKRTFGRPFGKYNPGTIKLNDILKKLPAEDKKELSREIVRKPKPKNEEYDLYDVILSHLIDEGYADTFEAAEAIMVNMSEDWRESIMEEVLDEGQKKYPTEKVENAGNRKVRTLRDPNISPEKRLKTTKQLNTITTSFMSHLTNRPQPVPPKRRK